ncbi:MAG: glycosyltransferase family 2 protein [Chitinispirillaceae bacterium]|nr:glycosyltransferase family 2 protein [Chitinispirillaceae bacterium]
MTTVWPGDIHVLIPAYEAAASLSILLPEVLDTVPSANLVVVDDGSKDATTALCRQSTIVCLRHPENKGKGAALRTGFLYLLERGARAIITLDADGQHAASDLPRFVAFFHEDQDAGLYIGKRNFSPGAMPLARIVSNTLTSWILSRLCGTPIPDSQCGYRLYTAELLKTITTTCPKFEMESEVIIKAVRAGFPVRFIEVQTLYFRSGSHIAHLADTLRWMRAMVGVWRLLKETRRDSP